MDFKTLEWVGGADGYLEMIDQRLLPGEFVKIRCADIESLYEAIKTLAVRGAPAIGVAAGYGVCLAVQKAGAQSTLREAVECVNKGVEYLGGSRPTAVNLFWAMERMKAFAVRFAAENAGADCGAMKEAMLGEAHAICREDVEMCRAIGANGERFISEGAGVLTHCNAGALATAGQGTALSPMYEAHKKGRRFRVFVDETRPLLQGSRLTAWELTRAGIDATLVCDNMAGMLMKEGKVDIVIVGADRIAANGDTANKIGTYGLSVLAKRHGVGFYVAAPSSTFDLSIENGGRIPIEQRDAGEVASFGARRTAPEGMKVYNPAFDVTEAGDITGIITELGVIERPDAGRISGLLCGKREKR
jgi:methylthioribose-1-phosphate isomerase